MKLEYSFNRMWSSLRGPGAVRLIVLGHQKSGTSAVGALLAKMLARSYAQDPFYACDVGRGQVAYEVVNGSVLLGQAVAANRSLFCRYVLKDPDLTFVVEQLPDVFPNAKLVFVVRDPRDTIRSIADRLKLSWEELSQPLKPQAAMNRHWKLILGGELPAGNFNGMAVAEVLAHRWVKAVSAYIEHQRGNLVIRYEDFCNDKIGSLTQLAKRLGLVARSDISRWVDVPFQPKGVGGASWDDRMGHHTVTIIEEVCSSHMRRFNYSQ